MLDSIWSAVSSIPDKIKELATAVGNFFSNFWENFTNGLSNIVTSIGNFFSDLGEGISSGFNSVINWFGNFFSSLLDFFYHIFVPTDEQWDSIKQDYQELSETFTNHLPFVSFFSNEVEKAKEIVYSEDFLNIKFDSWSFDLGVIEFSTPEINFTGVLDAYEPYRMTVRTFITYLLYTLLVVYIVKFVLKYGETQGNNSVVNKGGDD